MPYIKQNDRERIENDQGYLANPGELNYAFTMLCDEYLFQHGRNYANINAVIGALECAKMELYRRIAAPYEDKKIEENGDVYNEKNLS